MEAVAEEVSAAAMAEVEPLGVDAVESAEAVRELLARAGDDEVVVRAHEAIGLDAPTLLGDDLGEEGEEHEPVAVVPVHVATVDAAGGDVVDAVGEEAPGDAGHASTVRPPTGVRQRCGQAGTLSAHPTWLGETRARDSPWFSHRIHARVDVPCRYSVSSRRRVAPPPPSRSASSTWIPGASGAPP
jgi:hypothetical protein